MSATLTLEIGMPHLGRNNLSESGLWKILGHDRWNQIQELGGVATSQIRDDAGERLYATFYYLELNLSPEKPLSSYVENQVVRFERDLHHYEKIYLDGRYLFDGEPERWARCSNVFIYQERGPSKLSISVPATMDFSRIPELPEPPDSLELCRDSRGEGAFWAAEPGEWPLFPGQREYVYTLDADRDLNGAGLVYFANFLSFLDLAEREVLTALADPPPTGLLDARSPYRRRTGYFGNAQVTDRLVIGVAARVRMLAVQDGDPVMDLACDFTVRRSSDSKLVLISSCRKSAALAPGSESEAWVLRKRSSE
jgi:probable biosynthetic protein (TIGR04098 family)